MHVHKQTHLYALMQNEQHKLNTMVGDINKTYQYISAQQSPKPLPLKALLWKTQKDKKNHEIRKFKFNRHSPPSSSESIGGSTIVSG